MFNGRIHEVVAFEETSCLVARVKIRGRDKSVVPVGMTDDTFGYLRLQGIHAVSTEVEKTLTRNLSPISEEKFTKLQNSFRAVNWYK